MKPGITSVVVLVAASLSSLAAPIPTAVATPPRTLQLARATTLTGTSVNESGGAVTVATVQQELGPAESNTANGHERPQLLPRGAVTLDLLGTIVDTSSHATQGTELPRLASNAASGSDSVSTDLRLMSGGSDALSNAKNPEGQDVAHSALTHTVPPSTPRLEQLMDMARDGSRKAVDVPSTQRQRLAPYWHADQLPGKSKQRALSLAHEPSSSTNLGMANRRTSSLLSRQGGNASPLPPSTQQKAGAPPVRAAVVPKSVQEPMSHVVTNANRGSRDGPEAAETTHSAHPQPSGLTHAGEGTAQTNEAKSPLQAYAQKQADLLNFYLTAPKIGKLGKRPPNVIAAEKHIISQYEALKAESPEAEEALVKSLQSSSKANTLALAGIVNPGFPPDVWEQGVRVIYHRNRMHERFGTFAPQLAVLKKMRSEAAQAARGLERGSSGGEGASSLGRSGGTADVDTVTASAAGPSKRTLDSGTDSELPQAKRARSVAAFHEFIDLQKDLLIVSHGRSSRERDVQRAERSIISQYANLRPRDAAHAEELLQLLQATARPDKLAQAGIVRPDAIEEDVWKVALRTIYTRDKSHRLLGTFGPQLQALREARLRASGRAENTVEPK